MLSKRWISNTTHISLYITWLVASHNSRMGSSLLRMMLKSNCNCFAPISNFRASPELLACCFKLVVHCWLLFGPSLSSTTYIQTLVSNVPAFQKGLALSQSGNGPKRLTIHPLQPTDLYIPWKSLDDTQGRGPVVVSRRYVFIHANIPLTYASRSSSELYLCYCSFSVSTRFAQEDAANPSRRFWQMDEARRRPYSLHWPSLRTL